MAKLIETGDEGSFINIKVVGVGNAGSNIVKRISDKIQGITTVVFNTDANALKYSKADIKRQIGEKTTHGRGTGRDPEKGKFAANEDQEKIKDVLKNSDFVFLLAGLGGGTGTGSAPVIAKIAREQGAIVISLVTTPFDFEGEKRIKQAAAGLDILEEHIDTLIHIPNQRLYDSVDEKVMFTDAFGKVDEIISRTVASLSDLIYKPKILDIDFADICSIVANAGKGIVGLGSGKGSGRMTKAANNTIDDPLIEKSDIMEAKNILISITGSSNLTLKEVGDAMELIQSRIASPSKVLGVAIDETLEDEVNITLLATGIGGKMKQHEPEPVRITKPRQGEKPLFPETPAVVDDDIPAIERMKEGPK